MPDYEVVLIDGSVLRFSAVCDEDAASYIAEEEEIINQRNSVAAYLKGKQVKKDGKLL